MKVMMMTLSIMTSSIMQIADYASCVFLFCYAEGRYDECGYPVFHLAECCCAECRCSGCLYVSVIVLSVIVLKALC
jgi:hypothetical protein